MESGRVSLEDILKAGKKYKLSELMYVHRKMTEGFLFLEENGIANRDVKPGNIILVENPTQEGSYNYKISDFGISCKTENGLCTVSTTTISGYTEEFAAPEVLDLDEEDDNDQEEEKVEDKEKAEVPKVEVVYNPFLADVFSFGVLTLKMINRLWKRKDINSENLTDPENFPGYEPIIDLLNGMLQEDPRNRWNFKQI